jgi:hypothetical protein
MTEALVRSCKYVDRRLAIFMCWSMTDDVPANARTNTSKRWDATRWPAPSVGPFNGTCSARPI